MEDGTDSHEAALLKIYQRLRPGNPAQLEKARELFKEKFQDANRYRLGRVGRFRINRKFDQTVPETEMTLRSVDFVNSIKYLLDLRAGKGGVDDIDHLGNRRLRTIDELASDELRKGFLKLRAHGPGAHGDPRPAGHEPAHAHQPQERLGRHRVLLRPLANCRRSSTRPTRLRSSRTSGGCRPSGRAV